MDPKASPLFWQGISHALLLPITAHQPQCRGPSPRGLVQSLLRLSPPSSMCTCSQPGQSYHRGGKELSYEERPAMPLHPFWDFLSKNTASSWPHDPASPYLAAVGVMAGQSHIVSTENSGAFQVMMFICDLGCISLCGNTQL